MAENVVAMALASDDRDKSSVYMAEADDSWDECFEVID